MERMSKVFGVALVSMVAIGCGASSSGDKASAETGSPREAATTVHKFLEAVRTGSDETAAEMLTVLARQKTEESGQVVAPPGSKTAKFEVGEVELLDGGAHVASKWSDIGPDGQYTTDEIVWILRYEEKNWRIAGMATVLFPDLPPLFLNFEDPADMARKQQLAEQEMMRRAQAADAQARALLAPHAKQEDAVRR